MFCEYSDIITGSFSSFRVPFPSYYEREKWDAVTEERKKFIIGEAEKYLGFKWPVPTASLYLEYTRNGNRSRYESVIFNERRLPLQYFAAAECIEGKGRFSDDIINGIWATLDESSWVLPAHNYGNPLPDLSQPVIIDLFSAECGGIVSWILFELGEILDKTAPQITQRMRSVLNDRIFIPFIKNNYWWTGIDSNRAPNNWNPWIITNILTAVCFARPGKQTADAVLKKCLVCLDNFAKFYAPDGGCDEGPCYWGVAAGCLFESIEILSDIMGKKADFFSSELIRNMCSYIYKMHISGSYYVCYADADAKTVPNPHLLYRMGQKTNDINLIKTAGAIYREREREYSVCRMDGCSALMYSKMKELFSEPVLSSEKYNYPYIGDAWFEGMQVMCSRTAEGSSDGLFLSAKGGTNNESHNHNDIGSFVVYCDGKPAIIDVGRGEYVKQTFSERRYDIPQMQSGYHNLPIIGCFTQQDGDSFKACDVHYETSDRSSRLHLDLREAYPEDAGIIHWFRDFIFDKNSNIITVDDDFSLAKAENITFVFMTAKKPMFTENGIILVLDDESSLSMSFDASLSYSVEEFETSSDRSLKRSWGDGVYRVLLKTSYAFQSGRFIFTFQKK